MSKEKKNAEKFARVIISVSGGVAELIFKPAGLAVMLIDYDIDGVEEVSADPNGQKCIISHCDSQCKIISNEHWPVIQQSLCDIASSSTRCWQCPSCKHTLQCSYEQIVQIGTPHCPHCEIEMIMV